MKASDIAYIISLLEYHKERPELVKELQRIFRTAQSGKYGDRLKWPVMQELGVMEIERS